MVRYALAGSSRARAGLRIDSWQDCMWRQHLDLEGGRRRALAARPAEAAPRFVRRAEVSGNAEQLDARGFQRAGRCAISPCGRAPFRRAIRVHVIAAAVAGVVPLPFG